MQEKELLAKLSQLKSIEPRHDWVILTKSRILGIEEHQVLRDVQFSPVTRVLSHFRYLSRPAFVIAGITLFVLGGAFLQAQNSLPGDRLYSVRSVIERARFGLSFQEQSLVYMELAQRRLSDLRKVAEGNKVRNLPSAIKEFEASVSQASKSLAQLVENEPGKALQVGLEAVQLQKEKYQIEQILGTTLGGNGGELENATKKLIEAELTDLETRTLTEEQGILFEQAKTAFEEGDLQTALEQLWLVSNQL